MNLSNEYHHISQCIRKKKSYFLLLMRVCVSLHGFGSILEILITAQIICIVSNGPL